MCYWLSEQHRDEEEVGSEGINILTPKILFRPATYSKPVMFVSIYFWHTKTDKHDMQTMSKTKSQGYSPTVALDYKLMSLLFSD